jgi:hypothetical protein
LGVLGKAALVPAVGGLLGLIVGFPISLYALRTALTKSYKHFSIKFESHQNAG